MVAQTPAAGVAAGRARTARVPVGAWLEASRPAGVMTRLVAVLRALLDRVWPETFVVEWHHVMRALFVVFLIATVIGDLVNFDATTVVMLAVLTVSFAVQARGPSIEYLTADGVVVKPKAKPQPSTRQRFIR